MLVALPTRLVELPGLEDVGQPLDVPVFGGDNLVHDAVFDERKFRHVGVGDFQNSRNIYLSFSRGMIFTETGPLSFIEVWLRGK